MGEAAWHEGNAGTSVGGDADGGRSTGASVVAVLALVGIAVVVGVVDLVVQGQMPSVAAALASWVWVLNLVLVILAIVIVFMVIRLVFRGVGVAPHDRLRERRLRRLGYDDGPYSRDPAVDIARARYARGEISQDQLDQTLRQLGKSS